MWSEAEIRAQFPIVQKKIYLDSGSKCALALPVYNALQDFFEGCFQNGRDYAAWWAQVDTARHGIAGLIGATADEIAFFSSATHAVNVVAQGLPLKAGDNIVVAQDEFPSNLYPWLHLKAKGVEVRLVSAQRGELGPEQYEQWMDKDTKLVAVSHVQASSGYRADLAAFGELCARYGARLFVDATQACGVFPVDVEAENIDFLCASTYKWLLGTDGLAFLYGKKERQAELKFAYRGWAGRVEPNDYTHHRFDYPDSIRRFELGNHNYSAICALNAGISLLRSIGAEAVLERTQMLMRYLKKRLTQSAVLTSAYQFDEEHTGALAVAGCDTPYAAQMHHFLMDAGIITALKPNGIRLSPYFYNTEDEIEQAVEQMEVFAKRGKIM